MTAEARPRSVPALALADVVKRASLRAEEEAIALAVREAGGDRAAAATSLGVSVSTLNRRLRQEEPGGSAGS